MLTTDSLPPPADLPPSARRACSRPQTTIVERTHAPSRTPCFGRQPHAPSPEVDPTALRKRKQSSSPPDKGAKRPGRVPVGPAPPARAAGLEASHHVRACPRPCMQQ
jgi:hypothetical protein